MKYWITYAFILLLTIGSCLMMFILKYRVIDKEDELKAIHAQIREDSRAIHMLEAEWATRNDPDRLAKLITAETQWKPLVSNQVQSEENLPLKAAPVPKVKPRLDSNVEVQP